MSSTTRGGSQLAAKSVRTLQNLRVNGASSLDELAKLDPELAHDVKNIINGLATQKYVVSDKGVRLPKEPARYNLTEKGRKALLPKPIKEAAPKVAPKPICTLGNFPQKAGAHNAAQSAAKPTKPTRAGPVRISNTASTKAYNPGKDMLAPAARAGADAALAIPSRYGDRLHYRNGVNTDLSGQPI
jgi:hypothetical protein